MAALNTKRYLASFGDRVRLLRKERGLSQEQLAALCELDRSYVGGVERGERNVSLVNILRVCRALRVHPADLFDGWEK
ncbi:MAG: XRE family transcriptional regulator [Alphaproteobacteria bacterium HGW-Alphaproteobacteria-11]|nr:MAG: XRE family transcriptional regulator [Alphaproteobacteria bacterium HGW-Alphaproteobacteria-11]